MASDPSVAGYGLFALGWQAGYNTIKLVILYFIMDSAWFSDLPGRLRDEPIARLFLSYEALTAGGEALSAARFNLLRQSAALPGVLPVLIGSPPAAELRARLPLDGALYAGLDGAQIHEPEEAPDRLARHLRLADTSPPALRRALTGWVLANRSPADAFPVYVGCGALDQPAMELVRQLNGYSPAGAAPCDPRAAEDRAALFALLRAVTNAAALPDLPAKRQAA
ncbi:MAG: hypothetical protein AB1453_00555 [Chloroflexota bacterium]